MNYMLDLPSLVQAAGDAIIAADTDGKILLWNPAAERIFGFTAKDALGHSLDLIIPERLRHRHWEGYQRVMRTGQSRYGTEVLRVPALHKDGRALRSLSRSPCCTLGTVGFRRLPRSSAMRRRAGRKNVPCVGASPNSRHEADETACNGNLRQREPHGDSAEASV
jgi:PAS domain S-box-containing protein